MRKYPVPLVLVITAMAMVAAACGSSGDSPPPTITEIIAAPGPDDAQPDRDEPEIGPTTSTVGVSWIWTQEDELAPALSNFDAAATWYTVDWCRIEPSPGQRDWGPLDRNLDRAERFGIEVYVKIRVGSCWATGADQPGAEDRPFAPSSLPVDADAYGDFVAAVVERAGGRGVQRYAIENEVNEETFWQGTPDEYRRIVEWGAAAVRGADPDTRVVDGGLSSGAYGWALMEAPLDDGDIATVLDIYNRYYARRIGVRRYPAFDDPNELVPFMDTGFAHDSRDYFAVTADLVGRGVVDAWQLHLYDPWVNAAPIAELVRARTRPDVDIETWEAGIFWPGSDGDLDALGVETARLFASLLATGADPVVFLPVRYDFSKGRETRWGLVGEAVEPRPAGEVAALLHELTGRRTLRWSPPPEAGVMGAIGRDDEGTVAILWTEGELLVEPPPGAEVWEFGRQDTVTILRVPPAEG